MSLSPLSINRRRLLQGTGAATASRVVGLLGALYVQNASAATGKHTVSIASPFGSIAPVRDLSTGLSLL